MTLVEISLCLSNMNLDNLSVGYIVDNYGKHTQSRSITAFF